MPSFLDPGHGLLSSLDEIAIFVAGVVMFTVVGAAAEYFGDAKGGTVVGALAGFVAAAFLWAPPAFAGEWHYAVLVAVPVALLVYLYRGRGE